MPLGLVDELEDLWPKWYAYKRAKEAKRKAKEAEEDKQRMKEGRFYRSDFPNPPCGGAGLSERSPRGEDPRTEPKESKVIFSPFQFSNYYDIQSYCYRQPQAIC